MLNRLTIETTAAYCVGDIHGGFSTLEWYVKDKNITNSVFFLCGDVGLGFESIEHNKGQLKSLNKLAKKLNTYFVLVRGNHDDPMLYNCDKTPFGNFSNVFVVPDYTLVTLIDGERNINILCVGGAVSVDRRNRINKMNKQRVIVRRWHQGYSEQEIDKHIKHLYWETEPFVYNPTLLDEIKKNGIEINAVVTHTAPKFCFPIEKGNIGGFLAKDDKLAEELDKEREDVAELYEHLIRDKHPLRYWCYGHFHMKMTEEINGCLFSLLDMMRGNAIDYRQIF